jgi:acetolactate synthase-1/2/3 large subunit
MIDKGVGALHEIPDQLGMIRHITKWAERIDSPGDAPAAVREAMRQLHTGRVRPVEIEMAPDIMGLRAEVELLPPLTSWETPELDVDKLDQAARLLGEAQYPAIFVGGGGLEIGPALQQLAETLQAPVIKTSKARGALSDRHGLALTYIGGHKIWKNVDVVLAVGTRFDRVLGDWGTDDELTVIRMDIDPEEITRVKTPELDIIADAREGVTQLANRVEQYNRKRASRSEEMRALKERVADELFEMQPQQAICEVIREELPDDGIFVGDITQVGAYSEWGLPIYQPHTYVGAGFQGTLGYGFATALGAQAANPDKKVISANGDGGFLYCIGDLATAHQHSIPLVAIVFNDGAYGNVRWIQASRYGARHIASDLVNPDFVKLAESFNIAGRRAETPEQLREAIREGFGSNAPMLIDYPTAAMPAVRSHVRGLVRGG